MLNDLDLMAREWPAKYRCTGWPLLACNGCSTCSPPGRAPTEMWPRIVAGNSQETSPFFNITTTPLFWPRAPDFIIQHSQRDINWRRNCLKPENLTAMGTTECVLKYFFRADHASHLKSPSDHPQDLVLRGYHWVLLHARFMLVTWLLAQSVLGNVCVYLCHIHTT